MIAYFDCFSGISGDMTLGALIDLGVPVDWLEQKLSSLPLAEFKLVAKAKKRMGICGKNIKVKIDETPVSRDHALIRELIENAGLSKWVRGKSLEIFNNLALAEAKVHGNSPKHAHFHEVGGTDAIVDIVGSVLCLEYLGVDEVYASALPLGSGFVQCAHGTLPIPAPATVLLLSGCPTYGTDVPHELVTPTGAAIISTLSSGFGPCPPMVIAGVGYGMGYREIKSRPNCLRILTGELSNVLETDRVLIIETNIDDMNPEIFGFAQKRLFEAKALDVAWIPIFMKKNRPGTMIRVLCSPENKDAVVGVLLSETTATGIRFFEAAREKLPREHIQIKTPFGTIAAKRFTCPDGSIRVTPEYEACKKIAEEKNIPLRQVYEKIAKI